MCDIRRQLAKFHMTTCLPDSVSSSTKFLEKCTGYNMTDSNTPLMGHLVRKALRLNKGPVELKYGLSNYFSFHEQSAQYPNENSDGWMEAYVDKALPGFDQARFLSWLDACDDVESLLRSPGFTSEPPPKIVLKRTVLSGGGRTDPPRTGFVPVVAPTPLPRPARAFSKPSSPPPNDTSRHRGPVTSHSMTTTTPLAASSSSGATPSHPSSSNQRRPKYQPRPTLGNASNSASASSSSRTAAAETPMSERKGAPPVAPTRVSALREIEVGTGLVMGPDATASL